MYAEDAELVDRIYESSFVPELWTEVLDELGKRVDGTGGTLFISKADVEYWTSTPGEDRVRAERFFREGWIWRGQAMARSFAARHPGFLSILDLLTPEEVDQEPIYRDFFRPQGIGWFMGTVIYLPTGEKMTFVIPRQTARGPFEPNVVRSLDPLRPHLARSALMSARLQLERARIASETLASLGLPALVLGRDGKVLAANRLIEQLSGYVHWRAFDQLRFKDEAADQLLRGAVTGGEAVRSFPIRDNDTQASMVAHIIPIRLSARDIFTRCAAALVLSPITLPDAPPVELVQSLFDLTPAEARVARGLASGKTVDDLASDGRTSPHTIRTQVRGVLEKTGCKRQADVVALLTSISPGRLARRA
ncbi:MAG TPA: helix-turn-helix transcriptional regulator [Methylocella sp.]|nr:helix-turn-helix transcriptional regulator [Methylocella sp.]